MLASHTPVVRGKMAFTSAAAAATAAVAPRAAVPALNFPVLNPARVPS
jgi:hypothetical protein